MDRFSTHLPIIQEIFSFKKQIKNSLEFGMGNYSTEFLVSNTKEKVISIEMQSETWFNDIKLKFEKNSKWSGILCLGANNFLDLQYNKYDFVLVDGHGDSRPECINFISKFTDLIVTHDTEDSYYRWEKIKLDDSFLSIEDKRYEPYTKIFTKDVELINYLKNKIFNEDAK